MAQAEWGVKAAETGMMTIGRVKIGVWLNFFRKNLAENLAVSSEVATFAPASSGFGAVGSAHVWGARGRWFESSNPDTYQERLLSRVMPT